MWSTYRTEEWEWLASVICKPDTCTCSGGASNVCVLGMLWALWKTCNLEKREV